MRTISTDHERVLSGTATQVKLRVQIKDSGGTYRDLTSYPGYNAVLTASWGEDVDANGMDATIRLKRDQHDFSLAPLKQTSAPNVGFNPAGSYAPLIELARQMKIEWALIAEGAAVQSGDWNLAFEGYVDKISWASEEVELACRDNIARLEDTFIESERVYAHAQGGNATKGLRVFEPSTAYLLNELVMPSESNRNAHFYKVTTAGTTASTEPTWNTGSGSTTTSGTATFTEQGATSTTAGTAVQTIIQQIIDDNISSGPSLSTPVSPGWAITWYLQERTRVIDAIRVLVDQIGWDLRFRYVSGSMTLRLTEPNRSASSPDRTFGPSQYYEISQCDLDVSGIRNVVVVRYSDAADKDAGGVPKRKKVTSTDSASVTRFGRRYMEIGEASTSNINSSSEATDMADAVVADLATPNAEVVCEMPFFPFCELADLYRFSSNNRHWDTNLDLAVIGYQHEFADGKASTTLTCRGKPSAGYRRYHARAVATEIPQAATRENIADLDSNTGTGVVASSVVGGISVSVSELQSKHSALSGYELHASETASFTPSASTLRARGQQKELVASDLQPGVLYYLKTVPYSTVNGKIVRGLPSVETSVRAGRASAQHLDVQWWAQPLNGNFYAPYVAPNVDNIVTGKPEGWTVNTGTWGVNFSRVATQESGSALWVGIGDDLNGPSATCEIVSDFVGVAEEGRFVLTFWAASECDALGDVTVYLDTYTKAQVLQTSAWATIQLPAGSNTRRYSFWSDDGDITSPGFIKIRIKKTVTTNTVHAKFDQFSLRHVSLNAKQVVSAGPAVSVSDGTWTQVVPATVWLADYGAPVAVHFDGLLSCDSTSAQIDFKLVCENNQQGWSDFDHSQTFSIFVPVANAQVPLHLVWLFGVDDVGSNYLGARTTDLTVKFRIGAGTGTAEFDASSYVALSVFGGSFGQSW